MSGLVWRFLLRSPTKYILKRDKIFINNFLFVLQENYGLIIRNMLTIGQYDGINYKNGGECMGNQYKMEYQYYEGDGKYDGDLHRYTDSDLNGLSDKNLSSIELSQNVHNRDQYSAIFTFSTPTDERDRRVKNVLGLLEENAGITDARVNSHGNASGFTVKVDNLPQQDLMRLTLALTQAVHGESGQSHFPVLGEDIAGQIVDSELNRLNMTPTQAGLIAVAVSEILSIGRKQSYIDVDFKNCPISPVSHMREDGEFCDLGGRTAIQVHTNLHMREGQTSNVEQAMKKAGLQVTRIGNDQKDLRVDASADAVASAMRNAKMLPIYVAADICSTAEQAHQGQQKINQQIMEQSKQVVGVVDTKRQATPLIAR